MIFKRKIYGKLLDWKRTAKGLLVEELNRIEYKILFAHAKQKSSFTSFFLRIIIEIG